MFLVAFCAIWMFFYGLPMLSGIVSYTWPAYQSILGAIWSYLTLSYWATLKQALMAMAVLVGFAYAAWRRDLRWISVSYLLMGILYVVASATEGSAKHVLTGFWYTDPMRLSANAALFAMPLAALGFAVICDGVWRCLAKVRNIQDASCGRALGDCLVAAVLLASLLIPNRIYLGRPDSASPMEWVSMGLRLDYGMGASSAYDAREVAFVDQVKQVIDDDALVINDPVDGSVFAYGVNDLNVLYRYYSDISRTEDSEIIRSSLDEIAANERVRSAVDNLGARYVLLLDQPSREDEATTLSPFITREVWSGIDSISDDTPGFELMLAEDDMRLYRILSEEEMKAQA